MSLCSYIGNSQQICMTKLSIDCQFIVFRIREHVSVVEGGRTSNRQETCPIDRCVRILRRRVERRWRNRESLAIINSVAAGYKRISELGGRGTAVVISEGRVTNLVEVSRSLKGRVKPAPAGTYAEIAWTADNFVESPMTGWGICKSDSRGEILVSRRS